MRLNTKVLSTEKLSLKVAVVLIYLLINKSLIQYDIYSNTNKISLWANCKNLKVKVSQQNLL